MMTALSGTPGTGKSTVTDELERRGIPVTRVIDTVAQYRIGKDPERDTDIIDDERWTAEFRPVDGIVEGHLSHLLPADQVIILRCRPDVLKERLAARSYSEDKIRENVEAELLDVILAEAIGIHGESKVYEIDATEKTISELADQVCEIMNGIASPVSGTVDWLSCCGEML